MFENLKYWFSINHISRIRRHGLTKHLKFVFNFNLSRLVINMQMKLEDLPILQQPIGYSIYEMNTADKNEIDIWLNLINNSYNDSSESYDSFLTHISNHPFLTNIKVYFLRNDENNELIGTVTTGVYKSNQEFGGNARIAVSPKEQGKQLGYFLINFAFHTLKKEGMNYGETVISYHRTTSLVLHNKIGFKPEFDKNKIIFNNQKRMFPIRLLAKLRVEKLLKLK